jgi:outer membrane protein assembly factor BamA
MLPRLLLFTTFLLFGSGLSAQVTQQFNNLARTRVQYLLDKSMDFQPGLSPEHPLLKRSPVQSLEDQLEDVRQDLVNLPVFTKADWRIEVSGSDTTVHWDFEESRTIFPILNFGGIKGNTFYQIGFNDIHFRGRGQQLTASYQNNDGEHNYYLAFTNLAWRGSRWGYRLESRRYAAVEPVYFDEGSVNYRYANLSFGADLSYTFTPRNQLTFGLSTFNENYLKLEDAEGLPGPADINLNKFLVKASHTLDRVDHFGERQQGSHHQTIVQLVRTIGGGKGFLIGWHDYRRYQKLGQRGNLAARLRAGISSNDRTPFAPFVLDSQVNIRGSGNRIDRGTAQLILNLEYRHNVWKDKKDRFAVQLVGFSDLGTWRNPGGRIGDIFQSENIRHFVGGGVRLISLKAHNAVLRLDYGVDTRNKSERGFVAGFGQYF